MRFAILRLETISLDGGDLAWIAVVGLVFLAVMVGGFVGMCIVSSRAGRGKPAASVLFFAVTTLLVLTAIANKSIATLVPTGIFAAIYASSRTATSSVRTLRNDTTPGEDRKRGESAGPSDG